MKKGKKSEIIVVSSLIAILAILVIISCHRHGSGKGTESGNNMTAPPPNQLNIDLFNDFMPYVYFDDFDPDGSSTIEIVANIPANYEIENPDGPISPKTEDDGTIAYPINIISAPGEPAYIYTANINTGLTVNILDTAKIAVVITGSPNDTLGRTVVRHAQMSNTSFTAGDGNNAGAGTKTTEQSSVAKPHYIKSTTWSPKRGKTSHTIFDKVFVRHYSNH